MEYTKWLLDTSLDLNANPMRPPPLNTEVEGNSINELGKKMSAKEEVGALVEELNRVNEENKRLTEMSIVLCENYNALRSQLMDYMSKNRKRKTAESSITNNNGTNGHSESSSSDEDSSCKKPREEHIKPKISRVYVRTEPSDTGLLVKDGYQWRKYGQKVTRDNPCPRAYFKCSFAPSCLVKKKVQRSVEDQSVLVAHYEGEHNHPSPSRPVTTSASYSCTTSASVPYSTTLPSSGPNTITLDLTQPQPKLDAKSPTQRPHSPEFQQFLIEQMASALTKDPSFKSALAAAISGGFLQK